MSDKQDAEADLQDCAKALMFMARVAAHQIAKSIHESIPALKEQGEGPALESVEMHQRLLAAACQDFAEKSNASQGVIKWMEWAGDLNNAFPSDSNNRPKEGNDL